MRRTSRCTANHTQGVEILKVRTSRSILTVLALTGLVMAGLAVPAASGAPKYELRFLNQPADAEAGATITSTLFVAGTNFLQVALVDIDSGELVTNSNAFVTFRLASGSGLASGTLQVTPQPLVGGVATFGTDTLRILTDNESLFTDYKLEPRTTKPPVITGPASAGFDIWEDADTCLGVACTVSLRDGEDDYSVTTTGTLAASQLPSSVLPGLTCPGQAVVFSGSVFSHETTEDVPPFEPVFLENHITKRDWQASANNGQAHAEWCFGLKSPDAWEHNGASYTFKDTNGAEPDGWLYVGLAPKCPVHDPSDFAPCIVSQTGDGAGGSISRGWVPGGDPPRRT